MPFINLCDFTFKQVHVLFTKKKKKKKKEKKKAKFKCSS